MAHGACTPTIIQKENYEMELILTFVPYITMTKLFTHGVGCSTSATIPSLSTDLCSVHPLYSSVFVTEFNHEYGNTDC